MSRRTPGAVLLTWNDLASMEAFPHIEKYLNLKEPLVPIDIFQEENEKASRNIIEQSQDAYERYLYMMKKS